jgi:NADH-quinone oxidoreductase subunit A
MLFNFGNVLVFFLVGGGFVFVSLALGKLLRPSVPNQQKLATYECGEIPTEKAWINFNIRFYIFALLFIVFDVEIAFMFPIGTVYKQWIKDGSGLLAFTEIGIFILVLALALVWAWVKKDLEWVKQMTRETKVPGSEVTRASRIP